MKNFLLITALILITTLLGLIDIPALIKQKQTKELLVASTLLAIGFIMNLLFILGVKIPNPNQIVTSTIKTLLGLE